jgi:hypothetical protein
MAIYLGIANDGTFISLDDYKLQDSGSMYLYARPISDKWKLIFNNVTYNVNVDLETKESE